MEMAFVSENYAHMFCASRKKACMNPSYPLIFVNIKTHTHTHNHTFPGGDESGQELAEVGSGVRLLSQRKSFQLGGRTSVPNGGFFQMATVSLEDRS